MLFLEQSDIYDTNCQNAVYPQSFLYFKKNSPDGHFYDGKRDIESIEMFLYERYTLDRTDKVVKVKQPINELTDNDFDQFISDGYHFIKFYAPW